MARTSKAEVETVFRLLCQRAGVQALGIPGAPDVHATRDDGTYYARKGWHLDYASEYGGWVIASTDGEGTGEDRPCGITRRPAGAFVDAMRFAIDVIWQSELG